MKPQRHLQADRHVIRSINLREAAKAVDGVEQSAGTSAGDDKGICALDAVIERMKRSLADWPRRKLA